MKKAFYILFCLLSVFLVYILSHDTKIMYFNISDNNSVNYTNKVRNLLDSKKLLKEYINYVNKDYRICDFIHDIQDNRQIEYKNHIYNINYFLVKADLITINIGNTELFYYKDTKKNMYKVINELMSDYSELIKVIRNISKENIIIVSDFNIEKKYKTYIYNHLKLFESEYNVSVLDINNLIKYVQDVY